MDSTDSASGGPVFRVGLTSKTTLSTLNRMICEFYGHPGTDRANAARLASYAVDCVLSCDTRIGVIDDIHFINPAHKDGSRQPPDQHHQDGKVAGPYNQPVTTGQPPGTGDTGMVPAEGHGPVIDMDQPPDDRQFTLPWRRIGLVLAVLALAAGAYAATHGGGPPAPRPAGAPKPPVTAESLEPAGECAGMPDGTVIQVGHGFANRAGSPVTAESVTLTATQPLRALRLRDEGWGECGLPTATGAIVVQPGGTFNFTATFDLPATCPAVTELKFTVRWRADGADYSTPIDLAYLITELVPACHKSVPAAPVAPGSGR